MKFLCLLSDLILNCVHWANILNCSKMGILSWLLDVLVSGAWRMWLTVDVEVVYSGGLLWSVGLLLRTPEDSTGSVSLSQPTGFSRIVSAACPPRRCFLVPPDACRDLGSQCSTAQDLDSRSGHHHPWNRGAGLFRSLTSWGIETGGRKNYRITKELEEIMQDF